MDWADEVAASLTLAVDRYEAYITDDDPFVVVAQALRKAKADGLKRGAHLANIWQTDGKPHQRRVSNSRPSKIP